MTLCYVVVHFRDDCVVALLDDAPKYFHHRGKTNKARRSIHREAEIVRYVWPADGIGATCERAREAVEKFNNAINESEKQ